jgi:hypothetical protein
MTTAAPVRNDKGDFVLDSPLVLPTIALVMNVGVPILAPARAVAALTAVQSGATDRAT